MKLNVKFHSDDKTMKVGFDQYIGGSSSVEVPTKLSELENDVGYITENDLPEVPITSDDWSVTIDGKDFLNMSSEDSMSLSARNSMSLSSECDMSISASSIDVTGDMKVQAPKNDNSAVNKKYVDDAVKNVSGGGVTSWNDLEDRPFGVETTEWKQIASHRDIATVDSKTSITMFITPAVELGRKYRIVFKQCGMNVIYRESTVIAVAKPGAMGQYISLGTEEDDIYGYQLMANMPWSFMFKTAVDFPLGYDFFLYEADETYTTLDEKYIPDTIARKTDIPTIPSTDELVDSVIASLPIYNGEVEEV